MISKSYQDVRVGTREEESLETCISRHQLHRIVDLEEFSIRVVLNISDFFLQFLNFCISQGSIVEWEIQQESCCKFIAESNSERILKIGQHVPKLCLRLE